MMGFYVNFVSSRSSVLCAAQYDAARSTVPSDPHKDIPTITPAVPGIAWLPSHSRKSRADLTKDSAYTLPTDDFALLLLLLLFQLYCGTGRRPRAVHSLNSYDTSIIIECGSPGPHLQ